MGIKVDLKGKKFTRLTVIEDSGTRDSNGGCKWLCICDCGNISLVRGDSLISGHVVSCGCYNSDRTSAQFKTHGQSGNRTSEYNSWHAMMQRCYNPKNRNYKHYGGRGIKVCNSWKKFENFFKDMGRRPTNKHTLDRFPDNDGNYKLSNCRWATDEQQGRNKRNNKWLEYSGEKMVIQDWANRLNTTISGINKMIGRGKSFDEVVLFYTRKKTAA